MNQCISNKYKHFLLKKTKGDSEVERERERDGNLETSLYLIDNSMSTIGIHVC